MNNKPIIDFRNKCSLIFHLAVLNIKIRFKNTYLGILWAALEPLLYFIVLYVVFSGIRKTDTDFAIYLITGVMLYHIFSRGTSGGLISLTGNSGILKSISTNREYFPIVATVAIGLLAFVDVAVFFGLMPVFSFSPAWTIILLPIPILLVLLLILGLSYLLSIVNVYVRDTQNIWSILVHTFLFVSPIFWKVDEIGQGVLLFIHSINPLGQIINLAHQLVTSSKIPPLSEWLYTLTFVTAIFFVGYFVFHKLEDKIMEDM